MDIDDRREMEAAKNVIRLVQANSKRYGVKSLSLMTIGRGAMISAIRYHGG